MGCDYVFRSEVVRKLVILGGFMVKDRNGNRYVERGVLVFVLVLLLS